jgi:LAO/AO transport system kinase
LAVARALNLAAVTRPEARPRLAALLEALGDSGAARVGVTGPPGAGKSSLLSSLGHALRARGRSVGVVAVDPSSARTGGALLGDRARMTFDPEDAGLFVRSLATAGQGGGLSRAAADAVQILSSAFDVGFLETTGVGQSETAVEHAVDTVMLVVQPGGGDLLQFIKAGVMEIPDLLVVNKADLGALAERTYADLSAALASLRAAGVSTAAPVLRVSAKDGAGIEDLVDALEAHAASLAPTLHECRLKSAGWRAAGELQRLRGEHGVSALGGVDTLRSRFEKELAAGQSVPRVVASALAELDE